MIWSGLLYRNTEPLKIITWSGFCQVTTKPFQIHIVVTKPDNRTLGTPEPFKPTKSSTDDLNLSSITQNPVPKPLKPKTCVLLNLESYLNIGFIEWVLIVSKIHRLEVWRSKEGHGEESGREDARMGQEERLRSKTLTHKVVSTSGKGKS